MSVEQNNGPSEAEMIETGENNRENRVKMAKELADKVEVSFDPRTYSEQMIQAYFSNQEFREEMDKYLKNKTVIDLGCGIIADTFDEYGPFHIPWFVVSIASQSGASKYIGVDKNPNVVCDPSFKKNYEDKGIEIEVKGGEEGDMLVFLSEQENDSANIIINGIDRSIIDPSISANREYLERLANELSRVVGKNHVVIGMGAEMIFHNLEDVSMDTENMEHDGRKFSFVQIATNKEEK